jgi:hypothetical protein
MGAGIKPRKKKEHQDEFVPQSFLRNESASTLSPSRALSVHRKIKKIVIDHLCYNDSSYSTNNYADHPLETLPQKHLLPLHR